MQVFSVHEIIIVSTMSPFFIALLALVASTFQTRAAQQAEIVALRHQIAVLQQSAPRRLRLRQSDRLLWIWLSRFWPGWRRWLRILKPDTVVRWHRRAFTRYWTRKSRRRPGRPGLAAAIRDLIEQMGRANFLWGAPCIHGELLKLGIQVAPSTVGKYHRRGREMRHSSQNEIDTPTKRGIQITHEGKWASPIARSRNNPPATKKSGRQ